MKHIKKLLDVDWIKHCESEGWCSPIVLAPKHHKEHVVDIKDFVWRMRVSHRGLIKITNLFEYRISRCEVVIKDLNDGSGIICFMGLDAGQGYSSQKKRYGEGRIFYLDGEKILIPCHAL